MTETMIVKLNTDGIKVTEPAAEQLAKCEQFLNSVPELDKRMKLYGTLQDSLARIQRLGSAAILYKDFAPLSFGWSNGSWVGGIIFHGPCDGSAPNFSVSLTDTVGWEVHT